MKLQSKNLLNKQIGHLKINHTKI